MGIEIDFQFNNSGDVLVASFTPNKDNTLSNTTEYTIRRLLTKKGFDNLFILDSGIDSLRTAINNKEKISVDIAEKRDAIVNVQISDDSLQAILTVTKEFGGNSVTKKMITESLDEFGVKHGIIQKNIDNIVTAGYVENSVVAQGSAAVNGEPSKFESLLPQTKKAGPAINEQGVANFLDLHEFLVVENETELMRRIPNTLGCDGISVKGEAIKAIAGENVMFPDNIDGAKISPDDSNLLISAIKGHPIAKDNCVFVDATYVLEAVDISTGNVDFDGSVRITGDVKPGMKVVASGDIFIEGTVREAEISAQGNIVIEKGIMGGGIKKDQDNNSIKGTMITCGQDFKTLFIDNALVKAEKSIKISDYVSNSELSAGKVVIIGEDQKSKGSVIGGEISAVDLIQAKVLGSVAHVLTKVRVGTSKQARLKYKKISEELEEKEDKLNNVHKLLLKVGELEHKNTLDKKTKKTLASLVKTMQELIPEISGISKAKKKLKINAEQAAGPKIIVKNKIFEGVQITVDDETKKIINDSAGETFSLG